jgi:hypothetical protein
VADIMPGTEVTNLEIIVPQATLTRVQRELRRLPKEVQTRLSKDLRSELQGPASNIVRDFPSKAPMSGMNARWGRVKSSIRTYPNPRDGRAIATIGVAGENQQFNRLVAITERAGSRSPGLTPSGRTMIKTLDRPDRYPLVGRHGGRFIWKAWLKYRPQAVGGAINILERFVADYNRRSR